MKVDKDGKPIEDGQDGAAAGQDGEGADGKDGKDGKDGQDGAAAGQDGKDGKDGKDGQDGEGADGKDGKDGKDGQGGEGEDDKQFETLKFTEGAKINETAKKEFIEHCKKNGIKAETAQGFIDLQAKMNAEVAKEQEALRTAAISKWKSDVKKNYGVEFDQKLAAGQKALKVFGNKDLIDILSDTGENGTGLGNHPAIVSFLVAVGEKLQNDKFIPGGTGSPSLENRSFSDKAKGIYGDTMK